MQVTPAEIGARKPTITRSLCDTEDLFRQQRRLKQSLLDSPSAIRWKSARELAAYMLLSIDEPIVCWGLALDFLQRNLGVERVDGGFASPTDELYRPAFAECRSGPEVPSLLGLAVNNHAHSARKIWLSGCPLVHEDMEQDVVFDEALRRHFLSIGTVGKMTSAIFFENDPIGLVCADRMCKGAGWQSSQYECFDSVTRDVMAPILQAAKKSMLQYSGSDNEGQEAVPCRLASRLSTLSKTELQVCRLVASGMSYKEIGQHINRSFSTVDHHLRSIRSKLRVRSTGKLVSELSGLQGQISTLLCDPFCQQD